MLLAVRCTMYCSVSLNVDIRWYILSHSKPHLTLENSGNWMNLKLWEEWLINEILSAMLKFAKNYYYFKYLTLVTTYLSEKATTILNGKKDFYLCYKSLQNCVQNGNSSISTIRKGAVELSSHHSVSTTPIKTFPRRIQQMSLVTYERKQLV